MNADGSNPVNLTQHPADEAIPPDSFSFIDGSPTWSPDGNQLAFYSTRDGQDAEIFTMAANGRRLVQVTDNQVEDLDPAWSPFRDLIAFSSKRGGFPQIMLMDGEGLGFRPLTHDGIGSFGRDPAWSPNGERLAFTIRPVDDPDQDEVYIINVNGGGHLNLTNDPLFDSNPAWSPEGTKIAFSSDRLDRDRFGDNEIYVMTPTGSGLIQLTCNGSDDIQPAWSPDSTKIAYASNLNNNADHFDIYIMAVSSESCGFTD